MSAIFQAARRDAFAPLPPAPAPQKPLDLVFGRHALHHRRFSWTYLRDGDAEEARKSRACAWWYLRRAMMHRGHSPARQRRNAQ